MNDDLLSLWRTDAPAIENYARRALKDHHAAEDVVVEAVTRLGEALEAGRSVKSPAAYLWATALNLIRDEGHRRQRELPMGLHEDDEDGPVPFTNYRPLPLELADFPPEFDRALRELPEDERDAFILTELRGLTTREAGDVLEAGKSTIADRKERARDKLVRSLR